MSKAIILAAIQAGYFRAKKPEAKADIMAELLTLPELSEFTHETVDKVLQDETNRRHAVYMARQRATIDRQEKDAAKPVTASQNGAFDHAVKYGPGNYVFSVAQNNTDVDMVFLQALESFAIHNFARIIIARTTYNKNGFNNGEVEEGLFYDPAITKYLVEGHIDFGPIHFIADANVIVTAKNPLSGFESITPQGISAIIPASKIALKCTASLKGQDGKQLYGTGAITKRNYIMRKAGAVAATEHNIGALYVQVFQNGTYTAKQLELMPGENGFYDGGYYYSNNDTPCEAYNNVAALQFGDIHAEKLNKDQLRKMENLILEYKPANVLLHDVMDFSSRNHHNVKNAAFMFKQAMNGDTVEWDIKTVSNVIQALLISASEYGGKIKVIESNHDLAILTWLNNEDFKADPINAITFLKCTLAHYEAIQNDQDDKFNLLEWALENIGGLNNPDNSVQFHKVDSSLVIAGVEMGSHGHTGINGSRGSPAQFRTLGGAMNTGHTHTPSIIGGVYTAGCNELDMGYNIGASSWRIAHIITYINGQRQIIMQ